MTDRIMNTGDDVIDAPGERNHLPINRHAEREWPVVAVAAYGRKSHCVHKAISMLFWPGTKTRSVHKHGQQHPPSGNRDGNELPVSSGRRAVLVGVCKADGSRRTCCTIDV